MTAKLNIFLLEFILHSNPLRSSTRFVSCCVRLNHINKNLIICISLVAFAFCILLRSYCVSSSYLIFLIGIFFSSLSLRYLRFIIEQLRFILHERFYSFSIPLNDLERDAVRSDSRQAFGVAEEPQICKSSSLFLPPRVN